MKNLEENFQYDSQNRVFPATAQSVTYTGFDKADKVKQGNDSICYAYGYDRQRISMKEELGGNIRIKVTIHYYNTTVFLGQKTILSSNYETTY